jgi:arylsulfatase A-like enzyme
MVHLPLAVSKDFENRTGKLIWDAIEEVDWSVGEVLKAVKRNGIDDNTLVIFTSDNGAAVGSSLPLRARKGSVYDGGIREPTLMRWPGKIPADNACAAVGFNNHGRCGSHGIHGSRTEESTVPFPCIP